MTFSVKKLFDKKDDQATNAALQAEQKTQENAEKEAPKKKHGEPGVCCGSCS
ncbi:CCGSCS motif protein [Vibrio neonatus]|uniref:CCGSCS motif protein n=1 Tax=Vibrio neonatus TaxID=278860 RepID=UPI0021C37FC0|nr:CCGSCS motif protein [Vibrio neonatus]